MPPSAQAVTQRPASPEPNPRRRPANRAALLTIIGVCLMLAVGIAASWQQPADLQDEALLLEYPVLTINGKLPFRDYQSSYGIGSYLPLAGVYELVGPGVSAERAVGAAYRLAVVLAIVALLLPLGTAVLMAGGALAVVGILGPGPPAAYGWYAALACVLWSIWLARGTPLWGGARDSPLWGDTRGSPLWGGARAALRLTGAGALLGFAVSARPDILLAATIAGLFLFLGRTWRERGLVAAGVVVGLMPLAVNVVAAGLGPFWSYGVESRLHTLSESGQSLGGTTAGLAVALVGAVVLLLITAIRERRAHGPSPTTRAWLALSLVSAVSLAQAFQRPDAGHFAYVAPLILGLLPWAVDSVIKIRMRAGAAIALSCVAALLVHARTDQGPGYPVRAAGRSFPVATPADQRQLQRAIDYVDQHTSPGQRLFTGPLDLRWALWEDTALYYLMPALKPSGFYLELGPGDNTPRFTTREVSALDRSNVLVLDSATPAVREAVYPYARPGSDAPNRVVRREFRRAFRDGQISVWLRKRPIGA